MGYGHHIPPSGIVSDWYISILMDWWPLGICAISIIYIYIYLYNPNFDHGTHVLCMGRSGTVIICRCTSVILRFFSKLHITSQRQSSKLNTWTSWTPTISYYYFNQFYIRYGNQTWQWNITRFSSWHSHVFFANLESGFPVAIITGVLYTGLRKLAFTNPRLALFRQSRFSPQNKFDPLLMIFNQWNSLTGVGDLIPYWRSSISVIIENAD